MQKTTTLIASNNLNEWFKDRLLDVTRNSSLALSDDTLSYLVNLLVFYSDSRHFFEENDHGLSLPTLAFIFRDAQEAKTTSQKLIKLRRLGDVSLFIGSLFPDKLMRAGIKKDYFVGMGGGAYSTLAEQNYCNPDVFNELSVRFPRLLQIIGAVCHRNIQFDAEEIFALYRRWQASGDDTLKRQLYSLGINVLQTGRIQ
jgi:hypothetical protein